MNNEKIPSKVMARYLALFMIIVTHSVFVTTIYNPVWLLVIHTDINPYRDGFRDTISNMFD